LVEFLFGCVPVEGHTGSVVELVRDEGEMFGAVLGEVGAFGEVLAERSVGVLVGSALPGRVWITEVDGQVGGEGDLGVAGEFGAPVPGQGACQRGGEGVMVVIIASRIARAS
jgi:hypothetical protein